MENVVLDSVFGNMHYKHSWCKAEEISWWQGAKQSITVKAHAYHDQEIVQCQRDSYIKYKSKISEVIRSSMPLLIDYVSSNHGEIVSEQALLKKLIPRTVIFMRDSEWGILFDSEWDRENGIAIFTEQGKLRVGSQDDFL